MNFGDWRELSARSPAGAAREVRRRAETLLPPAARRAVFAWLPAEAELRAAFENPAPGPLRGIPCLIKDLFDVAGWPTFAGSTFLPEVRPVKGDSALVARLRATGAVPAGKTQMVEFASGLTGENPHYGDCPHPRFPGRLAGGSSSGSAAAVAAGVVPFAIGTDTGGSVRVPAAFCGLHGLRLTPGDAFIRDAFPLAPTFDTAGWFTRSAADLLSVTRALTGAGQPATRAPRGAWLGFDGWIDGPDAETAAACENAARRLAEPADADTRGELLSAWSRATEAYLVIGASESHGVHAAWLESHRARYSSVVWQRFHDGGLIPAEKIAWARQTLASVRETWARFFAVRDFLVLPAAPFPAPAKAQCTPENRLRMLTLTAPASLGGLPVVTLPAPLASGLSAGLQIVVPAIDSPVIPWVLSR